MKVRFQVKCVKCDKFMRYDADLFHKYRLMDWWCWDCELNVVTTDLTETIAEVDGIKDGDGEE